MSDSSVQPNALGMNRENTSGALFAYSIVISNKVEGKKKLLHAVAARAILEF